MSDLMLMKYSAVREAASTVEEYEWHLDTISWLKQYNSEVHRLDVTLSGKSILMGAFGEPRESEAYDQLCGQILQACSNYLVKCLPGIEDELRSVGVDPNA